MPQENLIVERTFQFGLDIIDWKEDVGSKQLYNLASH
jgi:hypothetical protein